MRATFKRKLAIGTTVLAAMAFAGGAYAASNNSPVNARQAFLNDVAKRLNVTPAQLQSALKGAFLDRLQAAVAAGKLTQAQADALKQRMQQNGGALPLPGLGLGLGAFKRGFFGGAPGAAGPGFGLHRLGGPLSAAATYLGISETQLLDQLQAGKTLAQIATAQGKTTSGLKDAMTAAIKAKLDKAVAAKVLTSAQEQQILSNLSSRLDAEISGKGFGMHGFERPWHGPMRVYPSAPVPPAALAVPAGPVY